MRRPVLAVMLSLLLAGCGGAPEAATPPSSTASSTAPSTTRPTTTTTELPPETTKTRPEQVVVLDPGHNGANAANPTEINRPVPAGRGKTKACNTTGTATNAGYPEHAFTWDVAVRVRDLLTAQGIQVILTRPDDNGVGPCVNERAAVGNEANAAAVVSIHADGSTNESAHGFHVAYSSPPLNEAQGEPAMTLATTMRDTMVSAGFTTSTYIGAKGLSPRDDLAGMNLSERPAILVECGNMRNADEAATFSSPEGRQTYADAIAAGIQAYLT